MKYQNLPTTLSRKHIYVLVFFFICLLTLLLAQIKLISNGLVKPYDYGIFQQAIFEMAAGNSLNPYVTVRDIHIFNDHFHPIIILAAPFVRLMNFHESGLMIFEWLSFILFLCVVYRLSPLPNRTQTLAFLGTLIFCKPLLVGLTYPVHPAFWATTLWFLIVYGIYRNNSFYVLLFGILICFFRTSYPFCIFTLGIYYLFKKDFKVSIPLLACSGALIVFTFFLREKFLGEIHNYSGSILGPLLSNPIQAIIQSFKQFDYNNLFKLFYPFAIPFYYLIKEVKSNKLQDPFIAVLFMISPFITIHFLANKIGWHYAQAIAVPILASFLFSSAFEKLMLNKKVSLLALSLFVASAMGTYTKFNKILFKKNTDNSYFVGPRAKSLKEVKVFLKTLDNKTVYSSPQAATSLIFPGLKIYIPKYDTKFRESYDYMVIDKSLEDMPKVAKNCSSYPKSFESPFYLVLKGPILPSCYKTLRGF